MIRRSLNPLFFVLALVLGMAGSAFAGEGGGAHKLPLYAEDLFAGFVSNSTVMVWLAVGVIVLFCKMATSKMSMVPAGLQNFAEWAVESLYDFLGGMLGEKLISRTFWFFGTIFFFILVNNYMGLIPGVGTVTYHGTPIMRGANADANMTLAMALTFALLWFYWAITETSVKDFMAHIFAPKGKFRGLMQGMMIPVFLFVGVLEVISIGVRPVALTFRLYGNIYGGEQTLEGLMHLTLLPDWIPTWLAASATSLPFYFMELLVGFVQALVFTLLCAIFLKLICDHGDEHH